MSAGTSSGRSQLWFEDLKIWIGFGLFVFFAAIVFSVIFLVVWGFTDWVQKVDGTKLLAAVMPLGAALVGGSIAFIGVVLRISQQRQAESRLRLDTIVSSVGLMSTSASNSQRAAGLLTLAELGHEEFAIALLRRLWPQWNLGPNEAMWVIDRAMDTDDPRVQLNAALCLQAEAHRLVHKDTHSFEWPRSFNNVKGEIDVLLLETLLRARVAMFCQSWLSPLRSGRSIVSFAHQVVLRDDAPDVRHAAASVSLALEVTQRRDEASFDELGIRYSWSDVREKAQSALKKNPKGSSLTDDLMSQVNRWISGELDVETKDPSSGVEDGFVSPE